MSRLFVRALSKFTIGLTLIWALVFIPAGTVRFFNGWLFMGVLFVPMIIAGTALLFKSPELLEKRLDAKEEQAEQKTVIRVSGAIFLAAFITAGLSFRFGWLPLPRWSAWAAAAVFLAGYAMYAEVLRENVYLSRTVEVQEGQRVISTGLYGIVRHPMYSATLVMFLSMGLVLGSVVSFGIMLLYIPTILMRIRNEEEVLTEGLEGYAEYKEKVRYRVIPFVW